MPNALRSIQRRRVRNGGRVDGAPRPIAGRLGRRTGTVRGADLPELARPGSTLRCDDQLYRQSLRNLIAVKMAL